MKPVLLSPVAKPLLWVACLLPFAWLVYAVVEGRPSHYSATLEVFPAGAAASRLVWTIDLLPDELAPFVGAMMDQAAGAVQKTLSA